MSVTVSTPENRARSLDIRQQRGAFKRSVRVLVRDEGCRLLAEVLADPPEWLLGAEVEEVLLWPRRMYAATVREWLDLVGVSPFRMHRVGSLSERQRGELVALLGGRR